MSVHAEKKPNRWAVLSVLIGNISMLFIDSTILPVALPTIQKELGISDLGLQWLVNSYLLALTVLLIAGGKLSDLYGRRKICALGLVIFTLSSIFCAFSQSETWFIIARSVQGVGAAFLIPSTSAILLSTFPPHERGRALGIYLGAGSFFLALGPLIGGLLTQYLNWRYAFWINVPAAGLGLLFLFLIVPKSDTHNEKFDLLGFLTLSLGISAIVIGLMETPRLGWGSWWVWILLVLGVGLITTLITVDRKIDHSFVDFSLFKNRQFVVGVLCIFLIQFLMMVTVFWAIYFQHLLNYSPSVAGSITLIANSPIIFMAPIAGYLTDHHGPKLPASLGFFLMFIGLICFTTLIGSKNFYLLVPALLLYGTGIPLVLNPCFVSSMNQLPMRKWGEGSALRQTIRQLGGTVGLAILGTLFLHWEMYRLGHFFIKNPLTANLNPKDYEGILANSEQAFLKVLTEVPDATAYAIRDNYLLAYESAFHIINIGSIFLSLIGFIVAILFLSPRPHSANHQ